jgi:hypothetical protein
MTVVQADIELSQHAGKKDAVVEESLRSRRQ